MQDSHSELVSRTLSPKAACAELPPGAVNVNVEGRRATTTEEGFGSLRERTYLAEMPGLAMSPAELIRAWKAGFPDFWPQGNHFYPCGGGVEPGVTAVINLLLPGGMKLYTGALVTSSGKESFSFTTLLGHMFAGSITFSAFSRDDVLHAQVQALIRPGDPLFELSFLLGLGMRAEDTFWLTALTNLGRHLGVEPVLRHSSRMLDRRLQWRNFGNLWYNAGIRSVLYQLGALFRARGA